VIDTFLMMETGSYIYVYKDKVFLFSLKFFNMQNYILGDTDTVTSYCK
jgi:hypothetical protein